jgi:hypothetical protein
MDKHEESETRQDISSGWDSANDAAMTLLKDVHNNIYAGLTAVMDFITVM